MRRWICVPFLLLSFQAFSQEAAPAPDRLTDLEQRQRILERKWEVAEEGAAERAAQAKAKANPDLLVHSTDGQVQVFLRGLVQADARIFLGDDARKLTDQSLVRRVRPTLAGKVANLVSFQLTPDFGVGAAVLQDAWLDFRLSETVQVRVGKFKSPFGLERLRSAAALGFVERAYPTQLAPNRDLGLQVHGEVLDKRLGYALAAVDGTPDGASVDGDTNDSKDLIAQLYAVPFIHSERTWLRELLVGGAWSWGDQDGTAAAPGLSPWRTPGQNAFYRVRAEATTKDSAGKTTTTPAVVARGVRQRVTLHGYWYGGPLSLFAEWVHTAENVQKGSDTGSLKTDAWQAAVAWVVGGNTGWNGVQPSQPFALGQPGWGAMELAARWSRLHVDGVDLERWADSKVSAQQADSLTAGLHWHWSQHLRLLADLEHTTFVGGDRDTAGHVANRPRELAILTRAQLAW